VPTPPQQQSAATPAPVPAPTRAAPAAGAPRMLWQRLLALAFAAIVPIALIAAIGAALLLLQQRHQAERAALDFTRAFANAIEAELGRSMAVLSVLATSPTLDRGDVDTFRDIALSVLANLPDWRSVILYDASGRPVVHTGFEPPLLPAPAVEPSLVRVLAERQPIVGRLRKGARGEWGLPIRYPVMRGGQLKYVVTGVLKPEAILRVMERQRVPQDWVITVFDGADVRMARSRAHEASVGGAPSPSLAAMMASGALEGLGITDTLEGQRVYTAYVKLPESNWTIAAGLPTSAFWADLRKAVLGYGGAIAFSLLAAAALAVRFAERINRPIRQLRDGARALGGGALPDVPRSDIVEVNEVADALAEAAHERARGEAEREALLVAERQARAAAEAARRRLELLAGSGGLLARSLETEATLQAVARSVVPGIVDWCNIDLVGDDGTLQRALVHHADPERRARVHALMMDTRPSAATEGSMAWAAQTGGSCIARYDSPRELERIEDADFRAIAQAMEMRVHFIVPLVARGRTLGAMAVAQAESGRDLSTDDMALLTELAQRAALAIDNARLYAQAEGARSQAEAANRAKDEFLAMLGHELRNPLAPIVTALELMRLRHADVAGRERAIIERQVRHLARLVDDLLDVARIAQGKVQLERRRTDLRHVVDRALELTAPALAERERIDVALPDQPVLVDGDEVRLVQVVCNLLNNAMKFTPPRQPIRLRLAAHDDAAVLTVSDEGQGIAPQLLPHVFDLFVQGEQALDRRGGGLGLGLGIVRTLVQMHRGTVEAASDGPGQGSCFTVRLPRVHGTASEPAAPPRDAAPMANGGRVLLVDDNVDAAQSLGAMLRSAGYAVHEAHDGPQALAAVAGGFVPDVALLDIGLPGMTGYELAAALRRDARLSGLTLIALTGYGRTPDRERALAADFDDHLVKPVKFDTLLQALARHAAA
jgi:signal transduction histidine kinase/ActR/RegA family two-component response regulator